MRVTKRIFRSASVIALVSMPCSSFHAHRLLSTSSWVRAKPLAMSRHLQGMYDSLASIQDVEASTKDPWGCVDVQRCVDHMSRVELNDLSLSGYPVKKTACMNIAETSRFQIAAFLLPKDRTLPVHDHPGMTVLSKVVVGELSVTSFTSDVGINFKSSLRVKLQEHSTKRPTDAPWIISPTIGNYHEFTAKSDCIILDVLLPPYAYPERPCHYYSAQPEETTNVNQDFGSTGGTTNSNPITTSAHWVLTKISDSEAHNLFGLPFSVECPGYVPSYKPS